jgi:hypothetical protein
MTKFIRLSVRLTQWSLLVVLSVGWIWSLPKTPHYLEYVSIVPGVHITQSIYNPSFVQFDGEDLLGGYDQVKAVGMAGGNGQLVLGKFDKTVGYKSPGEFSIPYPPPGWRYYSGTKPYWFHHIFSLYPAVSVIGAVHRDEDDHLDPLTRTGVIQDPDGTQHVLIVKDHGYTVATGLCPYLLAVVALWMLYPLIKRRVTTKARGFEVTTTNAIGVSHGKQKRGRTETEKGTHGRTRFPRQFAPFLCLYVQKRSPLHRFNHHHGVRRFGPELGVHSPPHELLSA